MVGLAVEAALRRVEDLVVGLGSRLARQREPLPQADALDRLDRAQRAGQAAVEALLPRDVGPQAGDQAVRPHLEDAAERLVGLALDVDVVDHRLRRRRVEAADRRGVDVGETVERERLAVVRRMDGADLHDVGDDVHAQRAQVLLEHGAARDSGGRLPRAGPLEHVADVGQLVLLRPGEVGVPRSRKMDLVDRAVDRPRAHPLGPVLVVAVGDLEGDRSAERPPVPHAGR